MAATSILIVPAGTTAPQLVAVTPLTSVYAGPSVLGGSVTLEFASSQQGPWFTVVTGTTGGSFRPVTTGYCRCTAATSAGNFAFSDLGLANSGFVDAMITSGLTFATPSTTSAVPMFAFKLPPNFLPLNFQMEIVGTVTLTNSATVKTLNVYANGLAGTALATSPSLASAANYTFRTLITGGGDGVTLKGTGVLASQTSAQGGSGISTTAMPTLVRDYIGQETEFVIGITKATGTDTAQLESLRVTLFN